MRLIGLAALAGTPTNCQYYSPSSEKSRWSRSHIWVTKIIFPKVEPGWGFGSIASEKNRQHAGYLGWGKTEGQNCRPSRWLCELLAHGIVVHRSALEHFYAHNMDRILIGINVRAELYVVSVMTLSIPQDSFTSQLFPSLSLTNITLSPSVLTVPFRVISGALAPESACVWAMHGLATSCLVCAKAVRLIANVTASKPTSTFSFGDLLKFCF